MKPLLRCGSCGRPFASSPAAECPDCGAPLCVRCADEWHGFCPEHAGEDER